jgi:hypothetical protein
MWLALRLELRELIGAYFAATFLWFFATREICSWRPSPVVEKGYDNPFSDKHGTCYVSAYESFWLHNVAWMIVPAVAVGFVMRVPGASVPRISTGRFLGFGGFFFAAYLALWCLN